MWGSMPTSCPVCTRPLPQEAFAKGAEGFSVDCRVCGRFILTDEAHEDGYLDTTSKRWTPPRRAALSHALRRRRDLPLHRRHTDLVLLSREALDAFLAAGASLPLPSDQARHVVRMIGDAEREAGTGAVIELDDYAWFGCANSLALERLVTQLSSTQKWLTYRLHDAGPRFQEVHLTFEGWSTWESMDQAEAVGKVGFLAMPFGNVALDKFVNEVVRPAVASVEGMSIYRIDDEAMTRAGIIDNLMRQAIREAAFIVADLSHGNNGAYWEAGYAEGLGKPVIYLCEKQLWEERRTHFDTNHCTTVVWDAEKPEEFAKQFVATLRNSLKMLATRSQ